MSFLLAIFKSIIFPFLLDIIYFPVWWYGVGFKKRLKGFANGVVNLFHNLALKLMITHLFKPMFGEYSRSGRIISFFMRLILLGWRIFLFLIGFSYQLVLLICWVGLPAFSVWQAIKLISL